MLTYTCPTCNESMQRDLVLFIRHTDVHIQQAQEEIQQRKAKPIRTFKFTHFKMNMGSFGIPVFH